MDTGTLVGLFFVAALFDAVIIMAIKQEGRRNSPVIFRALVAISIGFSLAFVLAAFVPGRDTFSAIAITLSLGFLFANVAANVIRVLLVCTAPAEAEWRGSIISRPARR